MGDSLLSLVHYFLQDGTDTSLIYMQVLIFACFNGLCRITPNRTTNLKINYCYIRYPTLFLSRMSQFYYTCMCIESWYYIISAVQYDNTCELSDMNTEMCRNLSQADPNLCSRPCFAQKICPTTCQTCRKYTYMYRAFPHEDI